jgi:predicted ABC-type sugar transport system permease subunit
MSQAAAPASAPGGGFRVSDALGKIGFLPLLLILVVVLMSIVEPKFYGTSNVINILRQASWLAIIACGQALVIIVGGFDLSRWPAWRWPRRWRRWRPPTRTRPPSPSRSA